MTVRLKCDDKGHFGRGYSVDTTRCFCYQTIAADPNSGPRSSRYATFRCGFESVAQLVEHRPFKALVLGSSPSALTIKHPINIGDINFSRYIRQLFYIP
jgi:hypothetical protein